MTSVLLLECPQQVLYVRLQGGDVTGRGVPHNARVDFEIPVHQDVAHADDLLPRNVWGEGPNVLRKGSGRLTNDLQVSQEPSLEQFIPFEGFLIADCVAVDAAMASRMSRRRSAASLILGPPEQALDHGCALSNPFQ